MADKKEEKKTGKMYAGQPHVTIRTEEDVKADQEFQKKFDDPEAIPLSAYFGIKGVRDPVMQAGMAAFTKVKRATLAKWEEIFKTY